MKKLIIITLILTLLVLCGCSEVKIINGNDNNPTTQFKESSDEIKLEGPYQVIRVVDGDTIIVDIDGVEERIRLIGIDTPESVHPDADRNVEYGKIASDFTKELLLNQEVFLEYDVQARDRYDRILAYVYINNVMFNMTLLKEGHAKVATYPPNVKFVDEFTALQEQARDAQKGVWSNESLTIVPQTSDTPTKIAYTGNSNTLKFHRNSCSSVGKINSDNLIYFKERTEAMDKGYVPCKTCNP